MRWSASEIFLLCTPHQSTASTACHSACSIVAPVRWRFWRSFRKLPLLRFIPPSGSIVALLTAFALLVSPASSASLHPPQAALRLRSHWRREDSELKGKPFGKPPSCTPPASFVGSPLKREPYRCRPQAAEGVNGWLFSPIGVIEEMLQ